MLKLLEAIPQIINDSQVDIVSSDTPTRPTGRHSGINTGAFKVVEAVVKRSYNTVTLPIMLKGATDMAYLFARGVACYGIGLVVDSEDEPKGCGAHSDQERIIEESLHRFVRFQLDIVTGLAVGTAGKQRTCLAVLYTKIIFIKQLNVKIL
jgi:hypothetical protein